MQRKELRKLILQRYDIKDLTNRKIEARRSLDARIDMTQKELDRLESKKLGLDSEDPNPEMRTLVEVSA